MFQNIQFIFTTIWILFYEYFNYKWKNHSYPIFIRNISKKLAKKNILYVKLFQAIAFNNNLINNEINAELLSFSNSAPYCEEDIDFFLLENLKYKYHLQFDNMCPINSGMISLVYKAKKPDNSFVILKTKRKNVKKQLDDSVKKFYYISYLLSFIPFLKRMNIHSTINKTLSQMNEQLNFLNEVKNTIEMKENCKNLDYVKIPEVYPEITYSYPDAIVMEYIDGKHINEIDKEDYEIYAKQVIKYGFVTSFITGLIHADMHSGNILFIKETGPIYKIAPIDFGIVTKIDQVARMEILEVISHLTTSDPKFISEKLIFSFLSPQNLKNVLAPIFYEKLVRIIENIVTKSLYEKNNINQILIYDFLKQFNDFLLLPELKNYDVKINEDFMKLQAAIAMANGISITLCKNDYMVVSISVLHELFHISLFTPDQ